MSLTAVTPDSLLSSIVEVGIALAGFTGLIVSLAKKREALIGNLLSVLIIAPSMIVVVSMIPLLLAIASVKESLIWQVSSTLMALYFLITFTLRSVLMSRLEKTSDGPRGGYWLIALTFSSFAFALLQIANIFYFQAAWPFLSYLIFYVLFCLVIFGRLVMGMWRGDA